MKRLLPRGPLDLLWQLAVLAAAYMTWRYARGAVDGTAASALAHARDLVSVERWLHSYVELDLQRWAVSSGWPGDAASWIYGHVHFWGMIAGLALVYFAHSRSFCFVRNAMIAAMAISLLGYWLYPTAPPRFVPELGFSSSIEVTGAKPLLASSDPLFNAYAAVPSMHVGFALILGLSLAFLSRPVALKVLFASYPLIMTFTVMATGHHFWLDAFFGAVAAALAFAVAEALARVRPEQWSLQPSRQPRPRPRGELPEPAGRPQGEAAAA